MTHPSLASLVSRSSTENDQVRPITSQTRGRKLENTVSFEVVADIASRLFVIGQNPEQRNLLGGRGRSRRNPSPRKPDLPKLSSKATLGRNSDFRHLSTEDKEHLGGLEYRALKELRVIAWVYFFSLEILGSSGLIPWILHGPPRYRDYLEKKGINPVWWAIYSAQTMSNNLGFTLTPNSMITFRDAKWPMILMTCLAFAGNTFYPILLRLIIWILTKAKSKNDSKQEALHFLLNHPRRCYTLLFPKRPTWILCGILLALNFIDVLFIIAFDLTNPEVAELSTSNTILASLFQAASSRHTGTSTFNLADVNPAVQLTLLVMMYIAVLPLAISIRSSNTYEERSLGIYKPEESVVDENTGKGYIATHMGKQFNFDMLYMFMGIITICGIESASTSNAADPVSLQHLLNPLRSHIRIRERRSLPWPSRYQYLFLRQIQSCEQIHNSRHDVPRPPPRPALPNRPRHHATQRQVHR